MTVMREKLPAVAGATLVLLGCLSSSPIDAAQQPPASDGEPVTVARFNAPAKPKPTFLWKQHPPLAEGVRHVHRHAAISGLGFSPGGEFGFGGDAFLAEYGTFAPVTTGINVQPAGFRVVRLDMKTRGGIVCRIDRDGQQTAARANGPVVAAAGTPEDQRTSEVPNVPETYKSGSGTLAS